MACQIGLFRGLGLLGPDPVGLPGGLGLLGPNQVGLPGGLGLLGPNQVGLPGGLGHVNHPSAIWTRSTSGNYMMMYNIYWYVCKEYEYRYGRVHGSFTLSDTLSKLPKNIIHDKQFDIPQCMPEYCKMPKCSISAYRNYYKKEKNSFAKWKNREVPFWY